VNIFQCFPITGEEDNFRAIPSPAQAKYAGSRLINLSGGLISKKVDAAVGQWYD
jgi:hypothetical protein